MINNYDKIAENYAKHSITGTSFLGFKNASKLISQYVSGKNTLDYGCGSGRSTRFLDALGLNVVGVDVNERILEQASIENQGRPIHYDALHQGTIPYAERTFDFVFSSMVLCGIASIKELVTVFTEIHRVLKKTGIFIAVTASSAQYTNKWLSIDTDFSQNKHLKSGDIAKIVLTNIGLELFDYYWTETDYDNVASVTGFTTLQKDHPLGDSNDGYDWKTERRIAPYITYVMKPDGIDVGGEDEW